MKLKRTKYPYYQLILILCFALPAKAHAQYINVTGKITDAQSLKPVSDAEIYLANTTIRTKTDENGNYKLLKLPVGVYELIAFAPGYETKQIELTTTLNDVVENIALNTRMILLPEVTIRESGDWKQNFARFEREFVGSSEQDMQCKILNKEILNLRYSSKNQRLTATTDDFLEIVNPTLGYKLRFLIKEFWVDYKAATYHYSGSAIFEELPGTEKEKKRWAQNRNDTYQGSFRHFMTVLATGESKKNGFIIKRLTRVPNINRPPDSVITYKISKQFTFKNNNKRNNDSLNKWAELRKLPKTIESLEKEDVADTTILKPGKLAQTYNLMFPGYLYVIYKNKYTPVEYNDLRLNREGDLYRFKEAKDYQISAVSMKTPGQPITFNSSGLQISKGQFFYEGSWGDSRIAKLLPQDFIPDIK